MSSRDSISSSLTHTDKAIDGASLLSLCLRAQGVRVVFGVVGIPVVEVAMAVQRASLTFVSCRNEQTASYAASVVSYLTATPAACLSVAGPGVLHSLAGVGNAWANRWAMLLVSAGTNAALRHSGAFQEAEQMESARPLVKFAARVTHLELLPALVERALREATYGRPGPVYLELPGELVLAVVDTARVQWKVRTPPPPRPIAQPDVINAAMSALLSASCPLLVVGKGAALGRAETALHRLVRLLPLPFLPTPMAKGLLPDEHPLCVSAARSHALRRADVVLLVGARLNWMLHFGDQGRYRDDVRLLHVDICAEEIGNGRPAAVALCGDAAAIVEQISDAVERRTGDRPDYAAWRTELSAIVQRNQETTRVLGLNSSTPITYYRVFAALSSVLPSTALVVAEGANTMDISRTCLQHSLPRSRLDAGTFATMGLGVGYAIAAALCCDPPRKVVTVQGDSAFGFSAMDFETAVRYALPITFVVFNNSGVYHGASDEERRAAHTDPWKTPVTALSFLTHYDCLGTMFGGRGRGWKVERSEQLEPVLREAVNWDGPAVVNVIIETQQGRKAATHSWMQSANAKL